MTVETTDRKAVFNGGQADHTFLFRAFPDYPEDIKVIKRLISSGEETSLTYDVDYTVSINSDGIGGTVTISPTISTLYTITVYRETTDKQESDYEDYNQFPADTLENDLDRRTMISQERSDEVSRAIKFAISYTGDAEVPAPEANKLLGWNQDADALENKTPADLSFITVSDDSVLATSSSVVPSQKAIVNYVGEQFNVVDYGAAADGVTDDTAAIKAAFYAAGTYGTIVFPEGSYLISDLVTTSTLFNGKIIGSGRGTIITQSNAAKAIFNLGVQATFLEVRDIYFIGGTEALIMNTSNIDLSNPRVNKCIFYNQTEKAVDLTIGSNSTELDVTECVFYSGTGKTPTFVYSSADYTNVKNCWVEGDIAAPAIINTGGTLRVENLVGVPTGTSSSCWIRNYGHAYLSNNRFGSEGGRGRTVLEQMSSSIAGNVFAENNYCPTSDFAYKFYKLPAWLSLIENWGYDDLGGTGCKGIFVGTGVTYTGIGKYLLKDKLALKFTKDADNSDLATKSIFAISEESDMPKHTQDVLLSDMTSSILSTSLPTSSSTNMTTGTATYAYLGGPTVLQLTSGKDGATLTSTRNDVISNQGTPGNVYTWVLDVYVAAATSPPTLYANIQGHARRWNLRSGLNILSLVAIEPATQTGWSFIFSEMRSASTIAIGRLRQFLGVKNINTINTLFHDLSSAVAPTSSYLYYCLGDKVDFANPSSSGSVGKIITTAGANGTEVWKNYGTIA